MATRFSLVFHGSDLVKVTSSDPAIPNLDQVPLVSNKTVTTEEVIVPARQAESFAKTVSHSFTRKD